MADEDNIYNLPLEIKGVEIKKEGTNAKGKAWTLYSYTCNTANNQKRFVSSFVKFDIGLIAQFCIKETENPKNADFPYLQILKLNEKLESMPEPTNPMDRGKLKPGSKHIDMTKFTKSYYQQIKPERRSLNHFIGTYMKFKFKGTDKVEAWKKAYEEGKHN